MNFGKCALLTTGILMWAATVCSAKSTIADFLKACESGTAQEVKVLLNSGAYAEAWNGYGWSALMIAARYNSDAEVVQTLLQAGADAESIDLTLLKSNKAMLPQDKERLREFISDRLQ